MSQCAIATIGSVTAAFSVILLMISISFRVRMGVAKSLSSESTLPYDGIRFQQKMLVDVLKMLFEKGPERIRGLLIVSGVFCTFIVACVVLAVIPYTGQMTSVGGGFFSICSAQMSVGLIYLLAITPFLAYVTRLIDLICRKDIPFTYDGFGYFVALELALLFAAISLFMLSGSFDLQKIIVSQGTLPWMWNVVRQPVAFILFALIFLLRQGKESAGDRNFPYIFVDHLNTLVLSTVFAVLFFGGWQIPFVNSEDVVANAVPIVVVGWPLIAVALCATGVWKLLSIGGGQFFGRISLTASLPWIVSGLALFALFVIFGDWALPSFVPSMMLIVLQLVSMTIKIILIYFAMVYLRLRLPKRWWSGVLKYSWHVILPLSVVNLLLTVAILLVFA